MPSRTFPAFDDSWIGETCGVHRRTHEFVKHARNPVLRADLPWEQEISVCGTVLSDRGRLRAWYQILNRKDPLDRRAETCVGYAESDDGIVWEKPLIGAELPGYGATNIVMLSSGRSDLCAPSVVRLPAGYGARYAMLFFDAMLEDDLNRLGAPFPSPPNVPGWRSVEGEGLFFCTSDDGVRWRRPARPFLGGPCDTCALSVLPDGRLLATFKTSVHPERHFRIIAAAVTDDGERWSEPSVILRPDWRDQAGTEFYGLSAIPYGKRLLGLVWVYHNAADAKHLDVQLALGAGPDQPLAPWRRALDRIPVLTCGSRGAWDAGRVYPASALIQPPSASGAQELWLYYGAANTRHDDRRFIQRHIGLATLRADGFASIAADHRGGWLVTTPILAEGRSLWLNIDARHGEVAVRARRDDRTDEWVEVATLGGVVAVAHRVDISAKITANTHVQMRFDLTSAELFSWGFEA